jgi:NADPH-dependent FMN reductase
MEDRAPRIIAFAGSLRADSNNERLARDMAAGAESTGAHVRVLDLEDYPLPVRDADLYDSVNGDPHALHDAGGRDGRHPFRHASSARPGRDGVDAARPERESTDHGLRAIARVAMEADGCPDAVECIDGRLRSYPEAAVKEAGFSSIEPGAERAQLSDPAWGS